MNHRLTIAAAMAVILASCSEVALISGIGWLGATCGAVLVVAVAGTLTRLAPAPAAIIATVLGGIAALALFAAPSLYLKAAGLVIVLCCAASATRLRLFRPVANLVTYLAALLLYLNAAFAAGKSLIAVVPTASSLRLLMSLLASDSAAMAKSPPPVPGTPGVILLAAGSIGLAAIIVDILAVRLHKPAIAGLPLLVIYMAPIATAAKADGVRSAFTFLLAAVGYLALLSSEGRNRLRSWGRVVTLWHYAGEDERLGGADVGAMAATGRRIGLAAVCAALIAPLLLPTLNLHRLFDDGHSGGPRTTEASFPDPTDQLQGMLTQPVESVLTYHSNASAAVTAQDYLQLYVDNYASAQGIWSPIGPNGASTVGTKALKGPPGLTFGTPFRKITTSVTLGEVTSGFSENFFSLPVPYWPVLLHVSGPWSQSSGTLMIYAADTNQAGQRYTVTSGQAEPTQTMLSLPQQTPPSVARAYLGFSAPSRVSKQLRNLALRITGPEHTAFLKAVALENWFQHSGHFTYSLTAKYRDSPAGLLKFLTVRQGFCQQFAFAMAVLARLAGIPSRVAVGYTAGTEGKGGRWLVTTHDGHAWPELYFTGVGWLRFEPTPSGTAAGQATATQPPYVLAASTSPTGPSTKTPHGGNTTTASPHPTTHNPFQHIQVPAPQGGTVPSLTAPRHGGVPSGSIALALLAVLVLAAAAPGTTRIVARRRQWRAAGDDASLARAAWQEVCADLDDFGLTCRTSESPRAVARRVCAATDIDEEARQAIGRIATTVERARYAPTPAAAGPIRSDVTRFRRSLARSSGWGIRARARLLPSSTLGPLMAAVRQGLGLLTGWMPSAGENAAT